MITRKQYMSSNDITLEDYYGQFVNESVIAHVVKMIGENRLLSIDLATDPHLNTIPLPTWDYLMTKMFIDAELWKDCELSTYSQDTQARRPFLWSASSNVCVSKTAARMFIKRNQA